MCGIFVYIGKPIDPQRLQEVFFETKHRGPNDSQFLIRYEYPENVTNAEPIRMLAFGFHRLSINGQNPMANQPFTDRGLITVCNGEIWNHPKLHTVSKTDNKSESDCECLSGFYRHCQQTRKHDNSEHSFETFCEELDGGFGLVMYDQCSKQLLVARDRLGIRSLYYTVTDDHNLIVASELKSIVPLIDKTDITIQPFLPGHWAEFDADSGTLIQIPYWTPSVVSKFAPLQNVTTMDTVDNETLSDTDVNTPKLAFDNEYKAFCTTFHDVLVNAVRKRFMSDRNIGCVLSGGLDSSVITAIACKLYNEVKGDSAPLRTYTIGMMGGTDFEWARKVAKHLGTEHHEFVLSESEFLEAIPKVIRQIESYDVTTVRASTGNWLVAKKIAEVNKDVVLFCGDVADELLGGYRGFGLTSDTKDFQAEIVKMLTNIHRFDVLRCEKSFSGHGLEARVPFADRDLLDLVLQAPPNYFMWGKHNDRVEKEVLRHAFCDYLPHDVMWRRKEAFSDGVSSTKKSWFEIIQNRLKSENHPCIQRDHASPYDLESSYYRHVFETMYGAERSAVIPYLWKQPFTTANEPSARSLKNYVSN